MATTVPRRIERFLDHLTVERGLAPNTVEAYRRDLSRFATYLRSRGVRSLGQADERTISAFVASLIMPNPKVHGFLDGAGTVEEALGKKAG